MQKLVLTLRIVLTQDVLQFRAGGANIRQIENQRRGSSFNYSLHGFNSRINSHSNTLLHALLKNTLLKCNTERETKPMVIHFNHTFLHAVDEYNSRHTITHTIKMQYRTLNKTDGISLYTHFSHAADEYNSRQ